MSIKKWLITLILGGTCLAASLAISSPEVISDDLKLKTQKENIISHKNIGLRELKEGEEKVEAVKYIYKTHKIKNEPNEIVSKRTGTSKTYKLNEKSKNGQQMYKAVIYSGEPQFYKHLETGDWFQAERAVTTEKAFQKQTKVSFIDRIFGKAYAADATYYPDPNVESTSVDGSVKETTDANWATIVAAAGDTAADTGVADQYAKIVATANENEWSELWRSIFLFDASASNGNTIESATFSLYGQFKDDGLSITPDLNVYSSAPASNTALGAGDFDSLGITAYSTAITYAGFSTTGYNAFTINAAGITFIQTAVDGDGIVKFGCRNANYDVAEEVGGSSAPAWTSGLNSYLYGYFADQAGTTNDPKLELTYSAAADTGNFFHFFQ